TIYGLSQNAEGCGSGSIRSFGGAAAAKPQLCSLGFTKKTDDKTPLLFADLAAGKHISEAVIALNRGYGGEESFSPSTYMEIILKDVVICHLGFMDTLGGLEPEEQIQLSFGKIKWVYYQGSETGMQIGSVEKTYDCVANKVN
ncbi:MAG: type VI secretion system tube protein Hcp, partial [Desulfobacterota bacterium]|nr:type VI secretion system tube protein Hcp [Thermodesulfobacteriota bacterium]